VILVNIFRFLVFFPFHRRKGARCEQLWFSSNDS
jgi:hypothetical protein